MLCKQDVSVIGTAKTFIGCRKKGLEIFFPPLIVNSCFYYHCANKAVVILFVQHIVIF